MELDAHDGRQSTAPRGRAGRTVTKGSRFGSPYCTMAGPPQLQAAGVGFEFFNEQPHHHREAQLPPRLSQRWPRALHWKKAAVLGPLGAGRTRGNKRSGAGGQTELRCGARPPSAPRAPSAELEPPPCPPVTAPPLTLRDKSGCSRQVPFRGMPDPRQRAERQVRETRGGHSHLTR